MDRFACTRVVLAGLVLLAGSSASSAEKPQREGAPAGGFLEKAASTANRPLVTAQIQPLLPDRGPFTFPAPYNTTGVRITNASDCGGSGDCVESVGYSYWRVINNHVGSNTMYIYLTLNNAK